MAILYTERLIMRPLQIDDLDDIFNYSCTPNVGPNAGWKPHESKEETLEIMNAIFPEQGNSVGNRTKRNRKNYWFDRSN